MGSGQSRTDRGTRLDGHGGGGGGVQPCAQEAAKDNGLQLKGKDAKVHWPRVPMTPTHGHKVSAAPSPPVGQRASVKQKKIVSFLLSSN